MPFPRSLLADHEKVVFDIKPHWVALVPPVGWTLSTLVIWVIGINLASDHLSGGAETFTERALTVVALVAILYLGIFPVLRWMNTHFVLTSDRLITRAGIIAKHSREIPLERINDVAFNQSMIERALGAGDLMIESAGERGQSRITNVRKPEQIQLMIYKETEENSNRMARGGLDAVPKEASVTEQIESLKRLADSGAITELEYENKKAELLKRL